MPDGERNVLSVAAVDDDGDDRMLMEAAARSAGLRMDFHFFKRGRKMVDFLSLNGRPASVDLIVMDLKMPGMDGHEVLREIKGYEHLQDVPTVVLTGSRSPDDVVTSYACGASAHMVKPRDFNGWILVVRLLEAIGLHSSAALLVGMDAAGLLRMAGPSPGADAAAPA